MAWSDAARAAALEARRRTAGSNSVRRHGPEGAALRAKQAGYLRGLRQAHTFGYMGAKPRGQLAVNTAHKIHAAYASNSKIDRAALDRAFKRIKLHQARLGRK